MNPDAQFAAFEEGGLDLGLSRPLLSEQRAYFEEEMIYSDYLVAVLPPKHPLAKERKIELQKLAYESFILFHRVGAPGLFDDAVALGRSAGLSPNVRHDTDLMTTVFLLGERALGASFA